jgi:hypothetical protein
MTNFILIGGTQMRDFLKKTAIATLILSFGGTAFAADHDHNRDHHREGIADRLRDDGMGYEGIAPANDGIYAAPMVVVSGSPMHVTRLNKVMGELRADTARLHVDRADRDLTNAQYRRLMTEVGEIHQEALLTARRHDGHIPRADFAMLQNKVDHLNRQIDRSA